MSARLLRRVAGAATALAALIALAACSPGSPTSPSSPSGSAAPASLLPPAEGTTTYPLTLATPFGDTVLGRRPERVAIVTASTVDTDALLALGGTPVFAPSTLERNAWLPADAVSGIGTLWESEAGAEVSVEKVAAAEPDLIVSLAAYDTFDQTRFDRLSSIAPVLYAPSGDLTWQAMTERLGEVVDLPRAASEVVRSAEESVAEVKAAHPEFAGRTASHVIVYAEEWGASYVSAPGTDTAALFEQLGFVLPAVAGEFAGDPSISNELVGLIDADFLLVSTFRDGTANYFVDSPLFKAVPAVAEGRVVINAGNQTTGINEFAWGLNSQSALSIPWLIERLAEFGDQAIG